MASFYEILQVSPQASEAVIRAAYRALAQQHHPDKNPGNAAAVERMRQVNQAYAVLSDPAHRARYDQAAGFGPLERRGSGLLRTAAAPQAGAFKGIRPFVFRKFA